MSDRMALLQAVAEAARVMMAEWEGEGMADMSDVRAALHALSSLPAEPEPEGEMVEVQADIYQSPACSEPLVCPSGFIPYLGVHIATITARIPRPVAPEVRAQVEKI